MKVLLLARIGTFKILGGDRVQIEQTAKCLNSLGVETEVGEGWNHDFSKYDLVHVFQLDWNPGAYFQIKNAKAAGKPVVFSPIHHNIDEVKRFDDEYPFDFRRLSRVLFKNQFDRDLFKEFYRGFFSLRQMMLVIYCFFRGLKNIYRDMLEMSDHVLVQTELEAQDLLNTFGVKFKWTIVTNGVGDVYINADTNSLRCPFNFSDYVICVGRIEPRKNQLKVIQAVKQIRDELNRDIKLVLIGRKGKYKHFEYFSLFEKYKKQFEWITHLEKVDYDQMPAYFAYAKVGVSASWFETTGLTSLEALFCGTNAVAAGNRAKEYLKNNATYCDPGDINSIKDAIKSAFLAQRPKLTKDFMQNYTWHVAASETLQVYNSLITH